MERKSEITDERFDFKRSHSGTMWRACFKKNNLKVNAFLKEINFTKKHVIFSLMLDDNNGVLSITKIDMNKCQKVEGTVIDGENVDCFIYHDPDPDGYIIFLQFPNKILNQILERVMKENKKC